MDAVLVTTSNYKQGRSAALNRMLASVAVAERTMKGRVRLFLLLQQCSPEQFGSFDAPPFAKVFRCAEQVSLSAARNRLLREVYAVPGLVSRDAVIAFPDDDCWYPHGNLENIIARFAAEGALDFFFCRYSSTPGTFAADDATATPDVRAVARNASSNTIFTRGDVVSAIGFFDEALGVGTPNGSGEDLDFALAAFTRARASRYRDAAIIGHRDKETLYRHRYYRGSLIVLARYGLSSVLLFREFLRKLLIGFYLTGTGKLPLGAALAATRIALAQLGTRRTLVQ